MILTKPFSMKVVGAFDIVNRAGQSVRPAGRKDCAILAMLALTRTHRQTRTWLQEKLWGDRGPAQAAASLRQSLTVLRGIVNTQGTALGADRTWVWLDPSKFDFDHLTDGAHGEVLRGMDLREDSFNDWLRDMRLAFQARDNHWGPQAPEAQPDRRWYIEAVEASLSDPAALGIHAYLTEGLTETLNILGLPAIHGAQGDTSASPRAADLIVQAKVLRIGDGGLLTVSARDGFGVIHWQVRREIEPHDWHSVLGTQREILQLFQDFVIRAEAARVKGARWSAHANACEALRGILVPGSVPHAEIARHAEVAIAADEKPIHHALLGFAHLFMHGERVALSPPDYAEIMGNFRTSLGQEPGNGLIHALAGHCYGFLMHDLDANADMTAEAVRLLPGNGACWLFRTISLVYCGKYAKAIAASEKTLQLCRGTILQPNAYSAQLYAKVMAGDMKGAIRAGERAMETIVYRPSIVDLMIAYSADGQVEKGREKLAHLQTREPGLTLDLLRSPDYPIVNHTHRARVVEAAGHLGLT